jgi:hypothetical protein
VDAYERGDLDTAIRLFRESYEVHHGHPNALYNIGECHERLEDIEQAVNYFEQYLASDLAEDRDQVRLRMQNLRQRRAVYTLRTVPTARVTVLDIQDRVLEEYAGLETPCEVQLPPGTYVVRFDAPGMPARTRVLEGGLGRRMTIEITLAEEPTGPVAPPPGGDEPAGPRGPTGPAFLGPFGGAAVHLNGAGSIIGTANFGAAGGYTLFDGDFRLDIGGRADVTIYDVYDNQAHETVGSYFIHLAAVPAFRWVVLEELHLVASLGIGVGIYVPPDDMHVKVPWIGGGLDAPTALVHLRPAIAIEYLPLSWLGIELTPAAFHIDIPVLADAQTAVLLRYAATLGLTFHF